jgi:hypothetical protein
MSGESDGATRLAVIFVQHDRGKYPRALPRLLGACGRLAAETELVVVDNALPGDWAHRISGSLVHIGGDNTHWEFSAFDRGLRWLEREGHRADVYALATDALLAYGDDFLELVDDAVVEACHRHSACIGWIDSFVERCEVLGYSYESWLRSSLLFLPASELSTVRPLAFEIRDSDLFGPDPGQPFRPLAALSANLRAFLLEWLTSNADGDKRLDEVWHSQFQLDEETFDRFKSKVKSILREHLLSARLQAHGARCYDLRAIRRASEMVILDSALAGEAAGDWQWRDWGRAAEAAAARAVSWESPSDQAAPAPGDDGPGDRPMLVLTGVGDRPDSAGAIRFFQLGVLPLVLQRHGGLQLAVEGVDPWLLDELARRGGVPLTAAGGDEEWRQAVALLVAPNGEPRPEILARAAAHHMPIVGGWSTLDGRQAIDGRHCLRAERSLEYATACCRLIEEPGLRAALGRGVRDLLGDREPAGQGPGL